MDFYNYGIFETSPDAIMQQYVEGTRKGGNGPTSYSVPRRSIEQFYRDMIYKLLLSRFEWEGLPETMNPFFFERGLVEHGKVLLFENENGYFGLPCTVDGLNIYSEPTHATVNSPTYSKRFDLSKDKCALIYNDERGRSDKQTIELFVQILTDIEIIQNVNMQTLRTPFILSGNQKIQQSLREQMNQILKGYMYLMVDEDAMKKTGGKFDAFNLNTPYYLDKLQQHLLEKKGALMESLGIDSNPNPRKKERLLSGEIETNDQETNMNRVTRIKMREFGATNALEKLGREISVKMSAAYNIAVVGGDTLDNPETKANESGSDENIEIEE